MFLCPCQYTDLTLQVLCEYQNTHSPCRVKTFLAGPHNFKDLFDGSDFKVGIRIGFRLLLGTAVRGWVIHYACESSYKDRRIRMCHVGETHIG